MKKHTSNSQSPPARRLLDLETFAWFCVGIGYLVGFQLLAVGGYEWFLFREATLSPEYLVAGVANPPYTGILLYPIALFPVRTGIFIFLLVSLFCLYAVHQLTAVNKWLLLLSYPAIRVLFYAQLDTLTLVGAALGFWALKSRRPYEIGFAVVLLGIKPQVGAVLGLVYLLRARDWRTLLIPAAFVLLSLSRYGFWPLTWPTHALELGSQYTLGGIGIWPWGVLAWPMILLARHSYSASQLVAAIVAANIVSSPYTGSYSILTTMAVPHPLWLYPLFTLPILLGTQAMLIPAVLLILYPPVLQLLAHAGRRLRSQPFDPNPG